MEEIPGTSAWYCSRANIHTKDRDGCGLELITTRKMAKKLKSSRPAVDRTSRDVLTLLCNQGWSGKGNVRVMFPAGTRKKAGYAQDRQSSPDEASLAA